MSDILNGLCLAKNAPSVNPIIRHDKVDLRFLSDFWNPRLRQKSHRDYPKNYGVETDFGFDPGCDFFHRSALPRGLNVTCSSAQFLKRKNSLGAVFVLV